MDESLISGFAQNNLSINIIAANNSSQMLNVSRIVRIIVLHSRYLILSLKSLFRSDKDDIIISFLDVTALYVFLLSKLLCKKRYIIALNIMYNQRHDFITRIKYNLFYHMLKSPTVYPTVTSRDLAPYYKRIFNLPNKDFFLVHDCYGSLEKNKRPFSKGSGYVFCGGTNSRDWDMIIKIAILLPHRKFIIVGPSKDILGTNYPANIEYHFNIKFEEFQFLLEKCSVVALPLITEAPAGLIVLCSAGLMSKPVVTTENISMKEYITSRENGILVKKGDYKNFADEVDNLVSDIQKQKEYGERLFIQIEDLCSPKAFANSIIAIINQI